MSLTTLASTRTRRILVVDDDQAVRSMISTHLGRSGFEITAVGDAGRALIEAQKGERGFDLVVTDVHMPGLSGLELAKLLLAKAPLRPVILITGDTDETLARQALSQGASGYLIKPFELFELDAVVEQALAMLQLVEATESLARAEAANEARASAGKLPDSWLRVSDERSDAGAGHGYRVARIAGAILGELKTVSLNPDERRALDTAARAHELGRLLGSVTRPADLALRTAQLLWDMGVLPAAVSYVKHMHEYWDGGGGPEGLQGKAIPIGAQILAVADAVDHHAVLHVSVNVQPEEASTHAIEDVIARKGTVFSPEVAEALDRARPTVQAIWTLAAAWVPE